MADVAGVLRSFHYAAQVPLRDESKTHYRSVDFQVLQQWADVWHRWVSVAFLDGYLGRASNEGLLPSNRQQLAVLLNAYLLEKALYELIYELNHRPDWVAIPLLGLSELLGSDLV
jgi:maltose alpha-D-glucosyltransferase/alpha-amylase